MRRSRCCLPACADGRLARRARRPVHSRFRVRLRSSPPRPSGRPQGTTFGRADQPVQTLASPWRSKQGEPGPTHSRVVRSGRLVGISVDDRLQPQAQVDTGLWGVCDRAFVSADVLAAADNNARWCDAVCRSHGLASHFLDDLWIAPDGSPRFYPDLVTLRPSACVADVVRHLPAGAEHIKDSFACLDLAREGFGVLFDTHWIVHRSPRSESLALGLDAGRQRGRSLTVGWRGPRGWRASSALR